MKNAMICAAVALGLCALACGENEARPRKSSSGAGGTSSGGGGSSSSGGGGSTSSGGGGMGGEEPTSWGANVAWQKPIATPHMLYLPQMAAAPDGTIYVLGQELLFGDPIDWSIVKIAPDGTAGGGDWPKTYSATYDSGPYGRRIAAMAVTPDGGVVLARQGGLGWLTTKFDAAGAVLWERELGTGPGAVPSAVAIDGQGVVTVVGQPGSYVPSSPKCYAVRYDAAGTFDEDYAVEIASAPGLFNCVAARADAVGGVYVAGLGIKEVSPGNEIAEGYTIRRIGPDGTLTPGWDVPELFQILINDSPFMATSDLIATHDQVFANLHRGGWGSSLKSQLVVAAPGGSVLADEGVDSAMNRIALAHGGDLVAHLIQTAQEQPPLLRWYDPSGPALTEVGSAMLPDLGSITHLEAAVGGAEGALFVLFWSPSGMQLVRVEPVPE